MISLTSDVQKREQSWPSSSKTITIEGDDNVNVTKKNQNQPRNKINHPGWKTDMEEFLSSFTAANPQYTEQCKSYLRSPQQFNEERTSFINWKWHFSQYNQDWTMIVNFFLDYAKSGKRGFYVESGANDYLRVSNTAFFDLCLGWEGICVEPTPQYHANIARHRSCKLVKNCLSDRNETINISGEIPGANVTGLSVECIRLDSLLQREGVSTVDVWSLDIEGFEHKALSGMDLTKIEVKSILMEQQDHSGACAQFPLDYKLTTAGGYRKYRIVSDAFYVNSGSGVEERYASGLQFPNVTELDRYFLELESKKCRDKGSEFSFFTDGWGNRTTR